MKRFVQSFPFLMVFGVCMHVACGDADNGTDTTGVGPVGSQGTGYNPACNLDRRDGYCNGLGQSPETCQCLDCANAAMCTGKCVNDGTCNYNPGEAEDCTCSDCNPGANCLAPEPDAGPTTDTVATTDASTTADTVASTTGNTVASTAASTSGGMGGQGGM